MVRSCHGLQGAAGAEGSCCSSAGDDRGRSARRATATSSRRTTAPPRSAWGSSRTRARPTSSASASCCSSSTVASSHPASRRRWRAVPSTASWCTISSTACWRRARAPPAARSRCALALSSSRQSLRSCGIHHPYMACAAGRAVVVPLPRAPDARGTPPRSHLRLGCARPPILRFRLSSEDVAIMNTEIFSKCNMQRFSATACSMWEATAARRRRPTSTPWCLQGDVHSDQYLSCGVLRAGTEMEPFVSSRSWTGIKLVDGDNDLGRTSAGHLPASDLVLTEPGLAVAYVAVVVAVHMSVGWRAMAMIVPQY